MWSSLKCNDFLNSNKLTSWSSSVRRQRTNVSARLVLRDSEEEAGREVTPPRVCEHP